MEEGSFKPFTGVELHSLSREERSSQDEHDMAVLGRAQELNVSTSKPSLDHVPKLSLSPTAQFPFHFNAGVRVHVDEHVGNILDVSLLSICLRQISDDSGTTGQASTDF